MESFGFTVSFYAWGLSAAGVAPWIMALPVFGILVVIALVTRKGAHRAIRLTYEEDPQDEA